MTEENKPAIDAATIAAIKAQVIEEMKSDDVRKEEMAKARREEEREKHAEYIQKMKDSPDPWVEVQGWTETDKGVRCELEWNDAFVKFLEESGIKGVDEEQTVQKWVALLLHDMAGQMEEKKDDEGTYE